MPVREFELFHGAVLTKLVRSDRPTTLRMIETIPGEAWAAYTINGEVTLLIKHSAAPRRLGRRSSGMRWSFRFGPDQIRQLSSANVWLALVCGTVRVGKIQMDICLLDPEQVDQLLDKSSLSQQAIAVRQLPGRSLRASSARIDEFVVPRNRLDTWEIPGS